MTTSKTSHVQYPSTDENKKTYTTEVLDVRTDVYQLPKASVKVNVSPRGALLSISVQCHDAYGYQRELFIGRSRTAGTHEHTWGWSAYLHPFHGSEGRGEASQGVLVRFMARFVGLVENYPGLLFNDVDEHPGRPHSDGFVRLHTMLLMGADLSVTLLD